MRVKITAQIGAGVFGKVYLLQCTKDQYALKVVNELHSQDDENRGDALLLRLCHAHLVRCWDAFLYGSNLYYVLELCSCGSLEQFLERRMRLLSQDRILIWFGQIADVLRYLHAMNIMHRDLKPANIFLDEKENIKVGDLGIARKLEFTKEQVKTAIGSLCYMSPELHDGIAYDFKVDIWSLGCCIHEMMTLNKTFSGKNLMELFHNIVTVTMPEIPDVYDKRLQDLVVSLLNHNPADRPDALQILYHVSRIRGKQFKPKPPKTVTEESFDHEQIFKAVTEFEYSSKATKITSLHSSFDDSQSETLRQFQNSCPKERGPPHPKPRKKKKKLTALRHLTSKDESSFESESSRVESYMKKLAYDSSLWLQEQDRHNRNKMSDDACEAYVVTLSTKNQSVSFVNEKALSESEHGTKNRIPQSAVNEPSKELKGIIRFMSKLCKGQDKRLSELMTMRVMGHLPFSTFG